MKHPLSSVFASIRVHSRFFLFLLLTATAQAADFTSNFQSTGDRIWIGPEYWANPLQDWQLKDGRLECAVSGGNRSLFLLTVEATAEPKPFTMSVRLGRLDHSAKESTQLGRGGFRLGIQGTLPGYRNAAIHGNGLDAGVTTAGHLFIGMKENDEIALPLDGPLDLVLTAKPGGENYTLTLEAKAGDQTANISAQIPAGKLTGYFALLSHFDSLAPSPADAKGKGKSKGRKPAASNRAGNVRFWFEDWKISGPKIQSHPERTFGPVLWTQHTLSRGTLKMTALMPPLGAKDSDSVRLEIKQGKNWKELAEEKIDPLARTATFKIDQWNDKKDTPYRVLYQNGDETSEWTGTIRKDPVDKELVVAGFTGNMDYLFPNERIATNVAIQNPDLLFFSGDQIYESVAGFGTERDTLEKASLDYLRKYWLFGWAFGELMRDRPAVILPDDHDVYQGNIWGHNGRQSHISGNADGGFQMDPQWVNMVNRTQTAHLPDPSDPTPLHQGITVYYTAMNYGRVSFAIIEDRKFKTGPAALLPNDRGRPDHVLPEEAPEGWDPLSLDVPEAKLLGERQLSFISDWATDWQGADFKCALSQTVFCNLANYHGGNQEFLVADLDSNGWPQTGRNKALQELRRGFAFMYAGDQHLASIVHHGTNLQRDSGFSFCVPSIAAGYPRSWRPDKEGRPVANRPEPGYPNTGDYREGLGNRVAVYAVANPATSNNTTTPETLGHDKASGHGLVRFDSTDHTITIECYRLLWDARSPKPGDQFEGWPRTITLEDNYGREAIASLPTLNISGMKDPVIQVIDETQGDIVYTLRINGTTFRPKVFDSNANYTIIVGEPSTNKTKTLTNIRPTQDEKATLDISL